jgi:hypothetical protein
MTVLSNSRELCFYKHGSREEKNTQPKVVWISFYPLKSMTYSKSHKSHNVALIVPHSSITLILS